MRRLVGFVLIVGSAVVLTTPNPNPQYSFFPAYTSVGQSYYAPDPLISSPSISQSSFVPSNSLGFMNGGFTTNNGFSSNGFTNSRFMTSNGFSGMGFTPIRMNVQQQSQPQLQQQQQPQPQQQSSGPGINSLFERVIEEATLFVENAEIPVSVNNSAHMRKFWWNLFPSMHTINSSNQNIYCT